VDDKKNVIDRYKASACAETRHKCLGISPESLVDHTALRQAQVSHKRTREQRTRDWHLRDAQGLGQCLHLLLHSLRVMNKGWEQIHAAKT